MKSFLLWLLMAFILALTACSETPSKAPAPEPVAPAPAPAPAEKRCTAGGQKVECPTVTEAEAKAAAAAYLKEANDMGEGKGDNTYGIAPFDYLTGVGKRSSASDTKTFGDNLVGGGFVKGGQVDGGSGNSSGRPGELPGYQDYVVKGKIEKAEIARRAEETQKQILAIEHERELQKQVLSAKHSKAIISKQVSPEFDTDAALLAHRDAYLNELKKLKQASYTFNPPSPIKVATPVTVFFWLDPLAEPMRLAEELKAKLLKMRPGETPQTEAGRMDWSPNMRATLTGEDFDITPTEAKNFDGLKNLSAIRRTEWSWDVKAKHIGQQLPLHLRVWTILPKELGEPYEVLKLDKLIHVEVTFLWLVDEYWEKYWKWILGGLGTALAGAIGTWWKSRQTKAAGI